MLPGSPPVPSKGPPYPKGPLPGEPAGSLDGVSSRLRRETFGPPGPPGLRK